MLISSLRSSRKSELVLREGASSEADEEEEEEEEAEANQHRRV